VVSKNRDLLGEIDLLDNMRQKVPNSMPGLTDILKLFKGTYVFGSTKPDGGAEVIEVVDLVDDD
jgi:hypothetical protein